MNKCRLANTGRTKDADMQCDARHFFAILIDVLNKTDEKADEYRMRRLAHEICLVNGRYDVRFHNIVNLIQWYRLPIHVRKHLCIEIFQFLGEARYHFACMLECDKLNYLDVTVNDAKYYPTLPIVETNRLRRLGCKSSNNEYVI